MPENIGVTDSRPFEIGDHLVVIGHKTPRWLCWHVLCFNGYWLATVIRRIALRFGREIWCRRDYLIVDEVSGNAVITAHPDSFSSDGRA